MFRAVNNNFAAVAAVSVPQFFFDTSPASFDFALLITCVSPFLDTSFGFISKTMWSHELHLLPPPPAFLHSAQPCFASFRKRRGGMFVQLRMRLPGQSNCLLQTLFLKTYRGGVFFSSAPAPCVPPPASSRMETPGRYVCAVENDITWAKI